MTKAFPPKANRGKSKPGINGPYGPIMPDKN